MSLQEALKRLRFELGMTQEDLAQKLGKAFVTVNRWENGKGFPSRGNAKAILDIAKQYHASQSCVDYLNETLLPDVKRGCSAAGYGFPDIDKEFLYQLADEATSALYVIEKGTYRMLYANREAERMAVDYLTGIGIPVTERNVAKQRDKRCFHYFSNQSEPCGFCPLAEIDDAGYRDVMLTIPQTGRKYLVHAKASERKGREVYIIYLSDVTQEDIERNALYELTNDIPTGVGIYHVYLDGRIELAFMNHILFKLIGRERGKALMQNDPSGVCLVHSEDKAVLMAEVQNSLVEKRNVSVDLRMRIRETEYAMVHIDARLIRSAKERLTYYCLFREL